MKGIEMYAKIHELIELGMSQNAVAVQLSINRATVRHYWNISADEYSKYSCSIRRISILDQYKNTIAGWIIQFPCISSAQICDWLKEYYPRLDLQCPQWYNELQAASWNNLDSPILSME